MKKPNSLPKRKPKVTLCWGIVWRNKLNLEEIYKTRRLARGNSIKGDVVARLRITTVRLVERV